MFAKHSATTVDEYLSMLPENREQAVRFMHDFIIKTVPKLTPYFATNMIGYGVFSYQDKRTKHQKEWPIIALANQKNYISLYVCAVRQDKYLPELYQQTLGNVSVGKSCIRFKKIDDLSLDVLARLLQEAERAPGLVGATMA